MGGLRQETEGNQEDQAEKSSQGWSLPHQTLGLIFPSSMSMAQVTHPHNRTRVGRRAANASP